MNHPKLQIAVITPNVLVNLGLKSILERIVPMAKVYAFTSMEEVGESGEHFYHHFVSAQIFFEHSATLLGEGRKPIILSDSVTPIASLAGLPHLNINQSEDALIRDILRLHHGAHPHGVHTPHGEHPSHGAHPCMDGDCGPHSGVQHPATSTTADGEEVLTAREVEVLTLIVKGLLNKEIADALNIGITTVISHRRNIVEKLGMRSVSSLTIYAVMRGYVSINEI